MQDQRRERAIWAGAAVGAVVVHLGLLIVMRPEPNIVPPLPDPAQAIQVTLVPVPDRDVDTDDERPRTSATREAIAPYPDPAALPSVPSQGPRVPRPTDRPSPAPGLPATPGSDTRPGINWSVTDPGDGPMRKMLRRSVGCDYGLKLTREEQAACDERFGRNRLKEGPDLRPVANARRARELEGEAERRMKQHEYKRQPPPVGTFDDLREMGGQPPQ